MKFAESKHIVYKSECLISSGRSFIMPNAESRFARCSAVHDLPADQVSHTILSVKKKLFEDSFCSCFFQCIGGEFILYPESLESSQHFFNSIVSAENLVDDKHRARPIIT